MNFFAFFRCNTLSPKSEIAIVAVTTQMVVSFLFLAVILALGVSLVNSERSKNRKSMEVGGAGVGRSVSRGLRSASRGVNSSTR